MYTFSTSLTTLLSANNCPNSNPTKSNFPSIPLLNSFSWKWQKQTKDKNSHRSVLTNDNWFLSYSQNEHFCSCMFPVYILFNSQDYVTLSFLKLTAILLPSFFHSTLCHWNRRLADKQTLDTKRRQKPFPNPIALLAITTEAMYTWKALDSYPGTKWANSQEVLLLSSLLLLLNHCEVTLTTLIRDFS